MWLRRAGYVALLAAALASWSFLAAEHVRFRRHLQWSSRISAVQEGEDRQARVRRILGPPDTVFRPGDFLRGFPLPGYVYVDHRPTGTVWVYRCPSVPPMAAYIYFDARGTVELVEFTLKP